MQAMTHDDPSKPRSRLERLADDLDSMGEEVAPLDPDDCPHERVFLCDPPSSAPLHVWEKERTEAVCQDCGAAWSAPAWWRGRGAVDFREQRLVRGAPSGWRRIR